MYFINVNFKHTPILPRAHKKRKRTPVCSGSPFVSENPFVSDNSGPYQAGISHVSGCEFSKHKTAFKNKKQVYSKRDLRHGRNSSYREDYCSQDKIKNNISSNMLFQHFLQHKVPNLHIKQHNSTTTFKNKFFNKSATNATHINKIQKR